MGSDVDARPHLVELLSRLLHRGGSWFESASESGWALGANRLAIVDRDRGRQPLHSASRRFLAVLNGEIYNHPELRVELEAIGYAFDTYTDTEVIATGFEAWGTELFSKLDGMFALIVVDTENGDMWAARDPMGVKPLYHCLDETGGWFLASEIRALISVGGQIEAILPGHWTRNSQAQQCYDFAALSQWKAGLQSAPEALRTLVAASVQKRLQTDLPVAVLLGGIDSSIVLYEANRAHPDVTAFTVGGDSSEDVHSARRLCAELGVRLVVVHTTEAELLATIPDTVLSIESFEPNHIRGGALSMLLCKAVSEHGYRLALCGEGADELFGGYPEFVRAFDVGALDGEITELLSRFRAELHRTQLQRLDRTAMRFTVEVREPFLDLALVRFAKSLPVDQLLVRISQNRVRDKRVLRDAYRGVLPDWIVDRQKAVLSHGAGFGTNGPEGPFHALGDRLITEGQLDLLRKEYPEYSLRSREEAYYFTLFIKSFGRLALSSDRPLVNTT